MAYSFSEGDTGAVLEVTCRNAAGDPIDLTNAVVKVTWKIDGAAKVTKTMTADPDQVGKKGVATYQFAALELTPGTMTYEIEITSAGSILTSPNTASFDIRKRLS